jgi:hypothetical protein
MKHCFLDESRRNEVRGNRTEGREVGQKMKKVKRDLKKNITQDTIFRM